MGKKFTFGRFIRILLISLFILSMLSVIILVPLAYIINSRNNMILKEENINKAWGQVQSVCQRRLDLVDNLVGSAKAYMQLEKDIFEAIAYARAGIDNAGTINELDIANENTSQVLSSFMDDFTIIVEDTPELKASGTIKDLMIQLEGTENRIAVERSRFNDAVMDYNVYIKLFPRNYIAKRYGFTEKEFFEAQAGAEIAPDVDLELD